MGIGGSGGFGEAAEFWVQNAKMGLGEVFTLPMYSTWNPSYSRWIPLIPDGIYFGWDPTLFGDSIPLIFHMEWPNSIWIPSFHLECLSGFHME